MYLTKLIEQAMAKPILYVGSPLRPQPGDPGWPQHRDAGDRSDTEYADRRVVTCYEAALAANIEFAEECCKEVALAGGVPYAPHLLFPRFFDDREATERDLSIICGLRMISICDEALFRVPRWRMGPSSGMKGEVDAAFALGVTAHVTLTDAGWRVHMDRLHAGVIRCRTLPMAVSA